MTTNETNPKTRQNTAWYPVERPEFPPEEITNEELHRLKDESKLVRAYMVSPNIGGTEAEINQIWISPDAAREKSRWDMYIESLLEAGARGLTVESNIKYFDNSRLIRSFTLMLDGPIQLSHTIHLFPSEDEAKPNDKREIMARGTGFHLPNPGQTDHWLKIRSRVAGIATLRQEQFSAWMKEKGGGWEFDLSKHDLLLSGQHFAVELIGDEATEQNTWLWSWARKHPFTPATSRESFDFHRLMEREAPETFTGSAQFPLTMEMNGHTISTTLCGMADQLRVYLAAPVQNSVCYLLVKNPPREIFQMADPKTFTEIVLQIIKVWNLDHQELIRGFAEDNGCRYNEETDQMTVIWPEKGYVEFSLEAFQGGTRIKSVQVSQ